MRKTTIINTALLLALTVSLGANLNKEFAYEYIGPSSYEFINDLEMDERIMMEMEDDYEIEEETYEEYPHTLIINTSENIKGFRKVDNSYLANSNIFLRDIIREVPKNTTTVYHITDKISYSNYRRTVTYYETTLTLEEYSGMINYTTVKTKTVKKGNVATRKNNPGNITCASGLRSKAHSILKRKASDPGDAKSCIYATVELGMLDYKNLLTSKQYNNRVISRDFAKYQSSKSGFKTKIRALLKKGINPYTTKYKNLSKRHKEVFANIFARFEGYVETTFNKTVVKEDTGAINNDLEELKSYLTTPQQVVTKIERGTYDYN